MLLQLLSTLHPSVLRRFLAQRATQLRLAGHHSHRSLRQPSSPLRTTMLAKTFLLSGYQLLSQLSTRPSLPCVPHPSALQPFLSQGASTIRHTDYHHHQSLRQPSLPPRTAALVKIFFLSSYHLLSQPSTRPSLLCVPHSSALQRFLSRKAMRHCDTSCHAYRSLYQSNLPPRTTMLVTISLLMSQPFLLPWMSRQLPRPLPTHTPARATMKRTAYTRFGMMNPNRHLSHWHLSH
jgi:hypothetical protein